jgi:hypothetical protein
VKGESTATLTVLSPSGGEPLQVPLTGTATEPPLPPAPPVAPAQASIDIDPGDRVHATPAGAVAVKLACAGGPGTSCEVTLTVARANSARGASYGFWVGVLPAGTEKKVTIALSAPARKLLGAKDKLGASIVLASNGVPAATPVTLVAPASPILVPRKVELDGAWLAVTLACARDDRCEGRVEVSVAWRKAPIAADEVKVGRGNRIVHLKLSRVLRDRLDVPGGAQVTVAGSAEDPVYQRTTTREAKLRVGPAS